MIPFGPAFPSLNTNCLIGMSYRGARLGRPVPKKVMGQRDRSAFQANLYIIRVFHGLLQWRLACHGPVAQLGRMTAIKHPAIPRKSIWLLTRWSGVRKARGLPARPENPRGPALGKDGVERWKGKRSGSQYGDVLLFRPTVLKCSQFLSWER